MVALLGDVDAGFGILLLVIFLYFFIRMIFSGGGNGTGESWNSRCVRSYRDCLKDDKYRWEVERAISMYYRLNSENQKKFLYRAEIPSPLKLQKMVFYLEDVMWIRGMILEKEENVKKRARNIARIKKSQEL